MLSKYAVRSADCLMCGIGETFIHSCPDDIYGHWAFAQILGLGEPAIPYMLGEIQRGRSKIVAALGSITGESPVLVSEPTTEEVTAAWMEWGEAQRLAIGRVGEGRHT